MEPPRHSSKPGGSWRRLDAHTAIAAYLRVVAPENEQPCMPPTPTPTPDSTGIIASDTKSLLIKVAPGKACRSEIPHQNVRAETPRVDARPAVCRLATVRGGRGV
ncbi:hypothetical protein AAFF_G00248980 [Aldrovandia affinis]|uniref:Uncharacterized protein n=1 Tax=Aldrovandia affinis TaxID=143900 RepID=A0AAD7RD41_9TELE|nr:hypothetical protein AAFF_G00248980 [Aldrovandia affinis]